MAALNSTNISTASRRKYEANRAAAVAAIHTRAQAEARQAKVRAQILSLIGALPGAHAAQRQSRWAKRRPEGFAFAK